ncbi:MAG: heme-binding protein [Gammaproteobacteria bacterium]|jgi:uncharacterized protein GlcG (DUF336 family)
MKSLHQLILSSVLLTPLLVFAEAEIPDVITVKKMSMELAAEIATKAVKTCRDQGYQVSAVVVDRSGNMQVAMRDVHASRFTLQIAEEKANAVILGGVSSGEIRKNRADIRQELNHVDGLLIMRGGLPIRAAGSIIGAVGVSGAPGGDKDEICAQKALDTVQERLDFIE